MLVLVGADEWEFKNEWIFILLHLEVCRARVSAGAKGDIIRRNSNFVGLQYLNVSYKKYLVAVV